MKERYEIKINAKTFYIFIVILVLIILGIVGYSYFNSNQKEKSVINYVCSSGTIVLDPSHCVKEENLNQREMTEKEENEILRKDLGETKELLQETSALLQQKQEELKKAVHDLEITTELLNKLTGNQNNNVKKEVSIDTLKRNAKRIDYDDLFRNNERYIDTPVVYTGEVIQIMGASGNRVYRINIEKDKILGISWVNTIYVTYSGDQRILEGDIVRFYGLVTGITSYSAILGNMVEIPQIQAYTLEIIQKAGDRNEI